MNLIISGATFVAPFIFPIIIDFCTYICYNDEKGGFNVEIRLIDLENWERREYYEHFIKNVVCSYSVTVNIDITNLKGHSLYPAMIWLLTKTVNDIPEFRTCLTEEGPGIYDSMHPMYTVFNKEKKNFSGIWSYFSED